MATALGSASLWRSGPVDEPGTAGPELQVDNALVERRACGAVHPVMALVKFRPFSSETFRE